MKGGTQPTWARQKIFKRDLSAPTAGRSHHSRHETYKRSSERARAEGGGGASERASGRERGRAEEREKAKVRGRAGEGEGEKVRARESARESKRERESKRGRAKEAHTDTPCPVLQTHRHARLRHSRAFVDPHTLPKKRETHSGETYTKVC